jgi:hypothetical protein
MPLQAVHPSTVGGRVSKNVSVPALLQSMTVHFLDGHREDWNKGAARLVAAAFTEGFPCDRPF